MHSIYIGLGGAGIDAAVAVFKKKSLQGGNLASNRYLLIDTDIATEKKLPEVLHKDFIGIGAKSPSQIKQEALNSPLKRWFVGWYDWYNADSPLHEGSGAVRQYGRISLWDRCDEVYQRLSTVISKSEQALSPTEQLNIFVITGSCGGTGSGITIDILYVINMIVRSYPNRCVNVNLLIALPDLWIEQEKSDVQYEFISNAVAFFKELQFAIDNAETVPAPYYPVVPPKEWMEREPFAPFKSGYAVESSRKSKEKVSMDIANLALALEEPNPVLPLNIRNLSDGVLTEQIESYKNISDGRFSFVDWKFCRQIIGMDDCGIGTEEIWNRMCKR